MTVSGSKVEVTEDLSTTIKNVKVGKIVKLEKHPNSDHMLVAQIDVGEDAPVQICTGAWNVHEGDLVPAALDGALLPSGAEIHNGKLRGVESDGMLCSLKELGMTAHDFPEAVIVPAAILGDYHPIDKNKPSISAEIKAGDSHTLSVVATSPNNGSLTYQWYSAATDNLNAALPIGGASDASYTIENASETAYYWAAVWNVKDGMRSQAVFTEAAEVRLAVEATPTPLPTEAPEPSPERSGLFSSDINFQLVMFSVIGLLALAALIGVVIFLRKDGKNREE
jgi:tRNA-binding EMAP/Myf-like protein